MIPLVKSSQVYRQKEDKRPLKTSIDAKEADMLMDSGFFEEER